MKQRVILVIGGAGQGIQVLGQLLSHAVVLEGKNVLYFSDRSGGQRTGPSECMVAVASGEIDAPTLIRQPADALIALDRRAFNLYQDCVRPGGVMLINTSLVDAQSQREDVEIICIPASHLAFEKIGNVLMTNMVAVGAFLHETGLTSPASASAALDQAVRPQRHQFNPDNRKALALGAEWVRGAGRIMNRSANRLFSGGKS